MQYAKLSIAVLALLNSATARSMLERAQEEDNFTNGKMDSSIGSIHDSKELKPENWENIMSEASITATADAIKKR